MVELCCLVNPQTVCLVCSERWCEKHWYEENSHSEGNHLGSCPKTKKRIRWVLELPNTHLIKLTDSNPAKYAIYE